LTGQVEWDRLNVLGVSFTIEVNGDSYDSDLFTGSFDDGNNDGTFDGIDIADFLGFTGVASGGFGLDGLDFESDLDIIATSTAIPMPLPAAMATVGLAAVVVRRRR
jgi:hypothetical protein